MRYKALSTFVRTPASEHQPQDPQTRSSTRVGLLLALSAVLVLSPVAFTYSDSTIVAPVAAEADAGNGRKASDATQNGRGNRPSVPPGQAKKSQPPLETPAPEPQSSTPTPVPSVAVTPTPQPTVATTPQPTTAPTATPDPTPPPTTLIGSCATGPGSAPSGWRRVMSDSFNEDIPLGEWGKPGGRWEFPGGVWRARPAGYKDSSGRGTYNSMKTTTQRDGKLDVWIHSEGSTRYVAAPLPLVDDTVGQRVSLCMRADEIPGYKVAFLLWPDQGPGNYHGEIDFPESKLLSTSTAHAFMHYDPEPASGKSQDGYDSGMRLQQWHTYTIEWHPGRNYVSFFADGRLIGRSEKPEVPNGPMHYVMQMETYVSGELPPPAQGHVLVDWFTIDVPA